MSKIRSGLDPDEESTEFTAFYHRNGGVEKDVLVQGVNEFIEQSEWSLLLDEGFERVADLLKGSDQIPVGERPDGEIFELSNGAERPEFHKRV